MLLSSSFCISLGGSLYHAIHFHCKHILRLLVLLGYIEQQSDRFKQYVISSQHTTHEELCIIDLAKTCSLTTGILSSCDLIDCISSCLLNTSFCSLHSLAVPHYICNRSTLNTSRIKTFQCPSFNLLEM